MLTDHIDGEIFKGPMLMTQYFSFSDSVLKFAQLSMLRHFPSLETVERGKCEIIVRKTIHYSKFVVN